MNEDQDIMLNPSFVNSLGQLFYAIASCDGLVHENESNMLSQILKKEWSQLVKLNPQFTMDYQLDILKSFNQIIAQKNESSEFYYKAFIDYKAEHEAQFTLPLKKFILNTCNAIASSYAQRNKSELIFLANLSLNFNKKTP